MTRRSFIAGAAMAVVALAASPASAQDFNWRGQDGQTINLMFNNHPWSQAMRDMAAEVTAKTGIKTRMEIFNEERFRARLTTLMQGRSSGIDGYMSLTSRGGAVSHTAGWHADLAPMMADKALTAPDFNYEDFGASIRTASTFGKEVVALPINQEGPLLYWRKDIFERCKIAELKYLEDIPAAAAAIKACEANQGAWAARGIRGLTPYALAAFVYNSGGSFARPDVKPGLSQPNSVKCL